MLAKAPSLGADEAIVDLEDAVAPEDKDAARELAVAAVRTRPLARTTAIRVNARGTDGGRTTSAPPRRRGPTSSYSPRSSPRRTCPPRPSCSRRASGSRRRSRRRAASRMPTDRGGRARARGARLRPGGSRGVARDSRPHDRGRRERLRLRACRRGCARRRPPGDRRPARPARRRPRPRRLRPPRVRARLRRQVGHPPEPDRAGAPRLHAVAGGGRAREANPRRAAGSGALRGRARRRGVTPSRRVAPQ